VRGPEKFLFNRVTDQKTPANSSAAEPSQTPNGPSAGFPDRAGVSPVSGTVDAAGNGLRGRLGKRTDGRRLIGRDRSFGRDWRFSRDRSFSRDGISAAVDFSRGGATVMIGAGTATAAAGPARVRRLCGATIGVRCAPNWREEADDSEHVAADQQQPEEENISIVTEAWSAGQVKGSCRSSQATIRGPLTSRSSRSFRPEFDHPPKVLQHADRLEETLSWPVLQHIAATFIS